MSATGEGIPLLAPSLTGNEAAYLRECVETGYVSSVGPFVSRFEREFAAFVGTAHAVACASGTAALHLALLAAGVAAGDDVLVSDFTFIAPANAVRYCSADPVLVASEPESWNLDPDAVVAELDARAGRGGPMPAAVVAVHALGHPARLEPIVEACRRHGVSLVEDAAEALGATWVGGELDERQVGTAGDAGCFSFNGNKVLTTGGGGMVVSDNPELAARARHLSTQAKLPGAHYRHDAVGYNYRMTNIAAAVGVAQLEQLPRFLERKRRIADVYDRCFEGSRVASPPNAAWARRSAWLYSVTLPTVAERDAALQALDARGVGARPVWDPVHSQPPYAAAPFLGDRAISAGIAERSLSLPTSPGLLDDQLEEIAAVVLESLGARR